MSIGAARKFLKKYPQYCFRNGRWGILESCDLRFFEVTVLYQLDTPIAYRTFDLRRTIISAYVSMDTTKNIIRFLKINKYKYTIK